MEAWIISVAIFVYGGLIFAVAGYGESWDCSGRHLRLWPWCYALSLAVYCTSWTFYGAVGTAVTVGWDFLAITLGPILVFLLAPAFLTRFAEAVMAESATSIADFMSIRYGKSRSIAALVACIALLAGVPYIALQLKSLSMSFATLARDNSGIADSNTILFAAIGLVLFTIIFGARRYEATGRNQGLVVALAFDSVFKLVALLVAAIIAIVMLFDAPMPAQQHAASFAATQFGPDTLGLRFLTVLLLSMLAIICLPRQFYVTFVECRDKAHVSKARWPFIIYLLMTAVVVPPIAMAGVSLLPNGSNPDLFVLQLPMAYSSNMLSLLVFLGGFAAAIGMIVASSLALSTMITHDLLTPILLRTELVTAQTDMGRLLLNVRRLSICIIILLAYVYYRNISAAQTLSAIGLIAFAGMAQFAPGLIGSFVWSKAHARGVRAGLFLGGVCWFYTLFLPSYLGADILEAVWLRNIAGGWLHPHHLLGVKTLDPLSHGTMFSLGINCLAFLLVSLRAHQGGRALIRLPQVTIGLDRFRSVRSAGDLMNLAARFIGRPQAEAAFAHHAGSQQQPWMPQKPLSAVEAQLAERLIASVIGASSARLILTSALSGARMEMTDIVSLLDATSQ